MSNNIETECTESNNIIVYYETENIKVLDNVLTDEECENIKSLQEEYGKVKINIPDISKKIEERCKKYILDKLYEYDNKNSRFSTDKCHYWNIKEINPEFRLYKCKKGRSISKHFDRVSVKSVDYKSMYSIIVYLETSDGNIKFKDIEIEPRKGRIVIFKQDLLHEGLENKIDIKYYMHSEILYKRCRSLEQENDKIALEIFNESRRVYNEKLYDESERLQDEAFKISPLLERIVLCLI